MAGTSVMGRRSRGSQKLRARESREWRVGIKGRKMLMIDRNEGGSSGQPQPLKKGIMVEKKPQEKNTVITYKPYKRMDIIVLMAKYSYTSFIINDL